MRGRPRSAGGTLIGLMFVAASVSAGSFSWDKRHALRLFLSSSLVQFASVLAAGMAVLLFAGIRNAWDITIWIVTHRGT